MAKVGEILWQPEEGWKRYQENDSSFTYIDGKYTGWARIKDTDNFSEGYAMRQIGENGYLTKIRFKALTDKIRIIIFSRYYASNNIEIKIDGTYYKFEARSYNLMKPTICFEKVDLEYKEHHIEITNLLDSDSNNNIFFDAVDIDKNGELRPYIKYTTIQTNNKYYYTEDNLIKYNNLSNLTKENYFLYNIKDINLFTSKSIKVEEQKVSEDVLEDGKIFTFPLKDKNYNQINKIYLE